MSNKRFVFFICSGIVLFWVLVVNLYNSIQPLSKEEIKSCEEVAAKMTNSGKLIYDIPSDNYVINASLTKINISIKNKRGMVTAKLINGELRYYINLQECEVICVCCVIGMLALCLYLLVVLAVGRIVDIIADKFF